MKKWLCKTTSESSWMNEISLTLLRLSAGLLMAYLHGFGKVPPNEKLVEGVSALGFPNPELFAWAAGLSELVGGVLLAVGFLTRPSALLFTFTMFVAAFGAHLNDPWDVRELSVLYMFIGLIFITRGSGKISVDHLIK